MTRSLQVVLYGRPAGQLTQTDGGSITFEYAGAYLDAADSTPLSLWLRGCCRGGISSSREQTGA